MSDNILSAICRVMLARDTDKASALLSGVHINPDGDLVRCEATNGHILAVCHAHKSGIELNAPVIISHEHLPRLVNFHTRNRKGLENIACRRDPANPGRPAVVVREINGDAQGSKVLEFAIPAMDDVCRVKLVAGIRFPNVRPQESGGKVWKIGIGGGHFNLRYLSLIPKILGGNYLPYTMSAKKTIWKSTTSGDYVLVMPMSVPEIEAKELFPAGSGIG